MTSSWMSRPKRGLVPPVVLYCEHNSTKISAKNSLLKICTLHHVDSHLSATLSTTITINSRKELKGTSAPRFTPLFIVPLERGTVYEANKKNRIKKYPHLAELWLLKVGHLSMVSKTQT